MPMRCYAPHQNNAYAYVHPSLQRVSGNGLALVGCSVEQDAAYWEWHIERTDGRSSDSIDAGLEDDDEEGDYSTPKFGVATKKDQKFYRAAEEREFDGELSLDEIVVVE